MMKILLPVATLLLLVATTPVLANHGHNNVVTENGCSISAIWKNHGAYVSCVAHLHLGGHSVSQAARSDIGKHHDGDNDEDDVSPTPKPCHDDQDRDDDDRDEDDNDEEGFLNFMTVEANFNEHCPSPSPSPSVSPSPQVSPSPSPEVSPSPSPEVSPSPSPEISPSPSPTITLGNDINASVEAKIHKLFEQINDLLERIQNLI